jgi:cellulose synthase/poly-beta-1,6-N-acetylglucosamine synthase-like glycosyltransferase
LIWVVYLIKGKKDIEYSVTYPSISLLIAVRNGEDSIVDKIKNSLSLHYPPDKYEIVIVSDGSTDRTEALAKPFVGKRVWFLSTGIHKGKNDALNEAFNICSGEIVAFSDVNTILEPDVLLKLVKYFSDPSVGGVCGNKVIVQDNNKLSWSQGIYLKFAASIKKLEGKTGYISSSDGTLYMIRRNLFKNIPPSVTDDLYTCLSVVKQNYGFLFESDAKAFIRASARSTRHEIQRRRRIVIGSLRGIFLMKEMLNPFRYGLFSISLIINKIFRRFLPGFLVLLFFSSLTLSFYHPCMKIFLVLQIAFYSFAILYWGILQYIPRLRIIKKIGATVFYFCIGNYGTLLGTIDFLRGRQAVKWEPVKGREINLVER